MNALARITGRARVAIVAGRAGPARRAPSSWCASPTETKTVTAHFPRAVSVYEGTDVRVLGVNVGHGDRGDPRGQLGARRDGVRRATSTCPDDAKAVVVTPTLVADRFVQLTPVYTERAR